MRNESDCPVFGLVGYEEFKRWPQSLTPSGLTLLQGRQGCEDFLLPKALRPLNSSIRKTFLIFVSPKTPGTRKISALAKQETQHLWTEGNQLVVS